ncbi:HPr(Ser) kinase/phosphatase [Bordetella genomosp. 4]|uniref:HPr kinase/phosphorylase n=1 Tax=Bordetella genomosp. 4 TaxID=463044 RepID=A0A261USP6_9BORD|nr:HPr(Ser) kinase/phosphatase [Bordetella genomosp. 4]OZI53207.1 HPr kinase/phosphorylase [Bordetella genomosp. 4]OZI64685.1 HPr kinase/phosphorylase [Bordetella genomosp. 4]
MLTVQELIDDNVGDIPLNWIAGQNAAQRAIPDDGMAAADLVGHLNLIHPSRVQVFGQEEIAYYQRIDRRRRTHLMDELLLGGVPAILLADGLTSTQDLIDQCEQHQVPLLSTPVAAAQLIDLLRIYLSKKLAPTTTVHGVFMDVLGLGVLITGESGLGKSELALELISRGHGLVADDAVEFSRIAPNMIEGHCPPLLQNMLEVRGLGLLDIRTIFGETSVRRKMRLKLIVHLVRATAQDKFERLPLQDITQDMLGLPVRKVMLQVAAGRNLAVLVEAAVRNTILKLRGIDTLGEFMERQAMAILQSSK